MESIFPFSENIEHPRSPLTPRSLANLGAPQITIDQQGFAAGRGDAAGQRRSKAVFPSPASEEVISTTLADDRYRNSAAPCRIERIDSEYWEVGRLTTTSCGSSCRTTPAPPQGRNAQQFFHLLGIAKSSYRASPAKMLPRRRRNRRQKRKADQNGLFRKRWNHRPAGPRTPAGVRLAGCLLRVVVLF